jgi:hypothetical protein
LKALFLFFSFLFFSFLFFSFVSFSLFFLRLSLFTPSRPVQVVVSLSLPHPILLALVLGHLVVRATRGSGLK